MVRNCNLGETHDLKTSLLRLTTNLSLDVFIGFLLIKVRTRLFDLSPKYDIGKSNHFRVLILLLAFCEENSTLLRTRKIKTQQAIPSKLLSYLYRKELLFFTPQPRKDIFEQKSHYIKALWLKCILRYPC